jgi:hypothetical protein
MLFCGRRWSWKLTLERLWRCCVSQHWYSKLVELYLHQQHCVCVQLSVWQQKTDANAGIDAGGAVLVSGGTPVFSNCNFAINNASVLCCSVDIDERALTSNRLWWCCAYLRRHSNLFGLHFCEQHGNELCLAVLARLITVADFKVDNGGAVRIDSGTPGFSNCNFTGNTASAFC